MRAFELLEDEYLTDIPKFYEKLKVECQPWFSENPNLVTAYRGIRISSTHDYQKPYPFLRKTRMNRKPLASSKGLHELMVDAFDAAGFVANRDNSIFVSGSFGQAASYGIIYAVVPRGEYQYAWSPKIEDLYGNVDELETELSAFDFTQISDEDKKSLIKQAIYSSLFYLKNISDKFVPYLISNGIDSLQEFNKLNPFKQHTIVSNFLKHYENDLEITTWFKPFLDNAYHTFMAKSERQQHKRISKDKMIQFVKDNFRSDGLVDGLEANVEIMIHCTDYWAIPRDIWEKIQHLHGKTI